MKGVVAITETFPLLRALLNLLQESLGRSKPATNLNTSTITHCVGFLLYPSLTEPSSRIKLALQDVSELFILIFYIT
jgi:hypothetical protein